MRRPSYPCSRLCENGFFPRAGALHDSQQLLQPRRNQPAERVAYMRGRGQRWGQRGDKPMQPASYYSDYGVAQEYRGRPRGRLRQRWES